MIEFLEVPTLQWNAQSWDKIIDWSNCHEPFILSKLDISVIEECYAKPFCFPNHPVHTQSVVRAVKLVTGASSNECG